MIGEMNPINNLYSLMKNVLEKNNVKHNKTKS